MSKKKKIKRLGKEWMRKARKDPDFIKYVESYIQTTPYTLTLTLADFEKKYYEGSFSAKEKSHE